MPCLNGNERCLTRQRLSLFSAPIVGGYLDKPLPTHIAVAASNLKQCERRRDLLLSDLSIDLTDPKLLPTNFAFTTQFALSPKVSSLTNEDSSWGCRCNRGELKTLGHKAYPSCIRGMSTGVRNGRS